MTNDNCNFQSNSSTHLAAAGLANTKYTLIAHCARINQQCSVINNTRQCLAVVRLTAYPVAAIATILSTHLLERNKFKGYLSGNLLHNTAFLGLVAHRTDSTANISWPKRPDFSFMMQALEPVFETQLTDHSMTSPEQQDKLISRMREIAESGGTPSQILRFLTIEQGIEQYILLMELFRDAFNTNMGSVTAIAGWWHEGQNELSDIDIDSYIMVVLEDYLAASNHS
jgi:hypothetical protein